MSVKAWLNWETLFLVMFPVVAKLAGNKQNVLLPRWLNEKTLFPKTNELRIRAMINRLPKKPGERYLHFHVPRATRSA